MQPLLPRRYSSAVLSLDTSVDFFEGWMPGRDGGAYWQTFERLLKAIRRSRSKGAFAGALALGAHGLMRATEDIDFLVHPEHRSRLLAALADFELQQDYDTLVVLKDPRTSIEVDVLVAFDSISLSACTDVAKATVRGRKVPVVKADELAAMKCVAAVDSPAIEAKQRADVELMVRRGLLDLPHVSRLLLEEAGPEYARFFREAVRRVRKTPERQPPKRRR